MSFSHILKQPGSIPAEDGLPIRYDLYVPGGNQEARFPVILFLHGFKGFKDWGPFPDACDELARAGFAVVAINFSMNGIGENPTEFDRLDLFARETLSRDLDEVELVIEALGQGKIRTDKAELDTDTLGMLGHSRGGHTAIAAAAEYPGVACLVTWAAVADYNARWTGEMKKDWETKGFTEILNGRTGQVMKIDKEVYEDARDHAGRVIAVNRIKDLHLPVLFIHSRDDESVPYKDAEALYRNCPSKDKELKLLTDTGHTFGGVHPFEEDEFPEKFNHVLQETIRWFQYYLG